MSHNASLLLVALVAVVGLIILIARFKLNAFVTLMLASLFVGVCSGMRLSDVPRGFLEGMGKVLGDIAMVIGLGTILGKMLAESGGAEIVAKRLIQTLGEGRLHWAMMFVAFIVGIPVFFAVGLVLLAPIVFRLARETKTPLLRLGIPLVAGLSVVHGLVPPHPGPVAAMGIFNELAGKADMGKTILYSLLVGLPTAVVAGPLFGRMAGDRVTVELHGVAEQLAPATRAGNPPSFLLTVFTILLPVLLMLLATAADLTLPKEHGWRQCADFAGHPAVAMLAAVLFSFYSFGFARGFTRDALSKFANDCLAPVASMLLVVGAGGGFSKVLDQGGVGKAIAELAGGANLSPLLLGWLVAALIRVATGSATVAITMAAGIVAPMAANTPGIHLELLVIAMGAGSLILSHVNDGGFWFVKEYFNLSVPQTLKTWTVMETIISLVALVLVLVLDWMI
ncbi:MAG TPA: gluconate:H+ symporter [Haliangiales bacterium]|nr:gluconate:H+ symporter [Haliangiales bacterium]